MASRCPPALCGRSGCARMAAVRLAAFARCGRNVGSLFGGRPFVLVPRLCTGKVPPDRWDIGGRIGTVLILIENRGKWCFPSVRWWFLTSQWGTKKRVNKNVKKTSKLEASLEPSFVTKSARLNRTELFFFSRVANREI